MSIDKIVIRCPFMEMLREHFPIIPLVFPLLPMLLLIAILAVCLHRISSGIERIEELLGQIAVDIRRS